MSPTTPEALLPKPRNLLDAISLFTESEEVKTNPKLLGNLKTTLKRYVLPKHGFTEESLSKRSDLDDAFAKVKLKNFKNAKTHFEDTASLLPEISRGTIDNYKSALNRFIRWMEVQDWYDEAAETYSGVYAPPLGRFGDSLKKATKGGRQHNSGNYGLKEFELTPRLISQLDQFHKFLTALEVPKRKDKAIRETTFASYKISLLSLLGWHKNIRKIPVDELDLTFLTDLDLLEEFIVWGINDRGNGYSWTSCLVGAVLNVAKWMHYKHSKKAHYQDIEEIQLLREYNTELAKKRKSEPSRLKLEERLISLERAIEIVEYLKKCCAPRDFHRVKRSKIAIMQSWQRYLIIAILTYCPVRQREIREFELGFNLFREEDCYWVKLTPEGHKTGSKSGKGREYPLPEHLTEDIDYWLNVLRPSVKTECNCMFFRLSNPNSSKAFGRSWNTANFSQMVSVTMFRATKFLFDDPKRTTPHDFRRIAVTWVYKHGNPMQREALAEMLGHSVKEAMDTYLKLTEREKSEGAKDWWKYKKEDK